MITLVILRDILRPKKIVHLSISRLLNKATLILLFLSCASYAQWSEPPSEEIVIRGGWLFDGISDIRRLNKGIVIREGKIIEIWSKCYILLISLWTLIGTQLLPIQYHQ